MALKTIKARAAQAAELLESLKRIARVRREACSSPVLVVYGQNEAASIYFEGEDGTPRNGRNPDRTGGDGSVADLPLHSP
jgi:hypothetical protein